ncbi:MAG: RDD family protein [Synergistaceae bacterium]|nr:RDD family protein [Synergistaceae bacterium]
MIEKSGHGGIGPRFKEWHCAFAGQAEGPYGEDQLRKMVQSGKLTEQTLVWNPEPGNAERGWVMARDTELATLFTQGILQGIPLSSDFPGIPDLSPQISATGAHVQEAWRPPSPSFERDMPSRAHESYESAATLKSRFFALLIDSLLSLIMALVAMIVCVALFSLLPYLFSMLGKYYDTRFFIIVMYCVVPVAGILIASLINISMIYRSGQTLGKKITGLRIKNVSGRRRSFFRNTVLRSLFKVLLLLPPLVVLDLCFLLRKDGRTLHDLIGGTVVISAR